MSYQSWSVSFAEQPSATKWNILGTNDAYFNSLLTGIGTIQSTVLTNPYKFSVYRNGAQSINATTVAKIAFDTKLFDTGTNFDVATNNRFIAPIAGFYFFSARAGMATGSADAENLYFYKNGSQILAGSSLVTSAAVYPDTGVTVAGLLQLAANDYIEVFINNGSGAGKALSVGQIETYFHGFLVSAT